MYQPACGLAHFVRRCVADIYSIDDADVTLSVSISDVRNNPSGSDYTGSVLATTNLQITDNANSEGPVSGGASA